MCRLARPFRAVSLSLLLLSCQGPSANEAPSQAAVDAGVAMQGRGIVGAPCGGAESCRSGACREGFCVVSDAGSEALFPDAAEAAGPDAAQPVDDVGASSCVAEDEGCFRSSECCGELRCRRGICVVPEVSDPEAPPLDPEVGEEEGCPDIPIGDPCELDPDCGEMGRCMLEFATGTAPGGYCYADLFELGCCPEGSRVSRGAGAASVCLKRCVQDSECREDEGYACGKGACVPWQPEDDGGNGLFGRENSAARCRDNFDNDSDDVTDCDDPDCAHTAPCDDIPDEQDLLACADLEDNDGDGLVDCDDPDCRPVVGACAEAPVLTPETSVRLCTDGDDNDGDGLIDCEDEDCNAVAACQMVPWFEDQDDTCADDQDNDGDGRWNCDDPDCLGTEPCPEGAERCQDGVDNDGNGLVDCDDPACDQADNCGNRVAEDTDLMCTNGRDDDLDGLVDCGDPDCEGQGGCEALADNEGSVAHCINLVDDDGDALVDCEDPDCRPPLLCDGPCGDCEDVEDTDDLCSDRLDNDGDGVLDCEDPDCALTLRCEEPPEDAGGEGQLGGFTCYDEVDNDADGLTDCEDGECVQSHHCRNVVIGEGAMVGTCEDGEDNDLDGLVDCDDAECAFFGRCLEEVGDGNDHGREGAAVDSCENGLDDDEDELIDCEDDDCDNSPACNRNGQ